MLVHPTLLLLLVVMIVLQTRVTVLYRVGETVQIGVRTRRVGVMTRVRFGARVGRSGQAGDKSPMIGAVVPHRSGGDNQGWEWLTPPVIPPGSQVPDQLRRLLQGGVGVRPEEGCRRLGEGISGEEGRLEPTLATQTDTVHQLGPGHHQYRTHVGDEDHDEGDVHANAGSVTMGKLLSASRRRNDRECITMQMILC